MGTRRPTMSDVAGAAGVSLKTVSRVVNGVASVDGQLAARVNAAIVDLGYRHNLLAAGLKAGSGPRLIGLITANLSDPFFGALAASVDAVARAHGHGVLMTGSAEDPTTERAVAQDLCARQVRGLIVTPVGESSAYLADEVARGLRVVFLDRPGAGIEADTVLVDNRGLGRRMAELALERGHRRIGILQGGSTVYTHRERYAGIRETLDAAGIAPDAELVARDLVEPDEAEASARGMLALEDPPTVLLCTNNRLTLGAVSALCHAGAWADLIVFDNPEYADVLPVPLTLIAQDPGELGRIAAERLFARLDGDDSPAATHMVPTELVERGGAWQLNLG